MKLSGISERDGKGGPPLGARLFLFGFRAAVIYIILKTAVAGNPALRAVNNRPYELVYLGEANLFISAKPIIWERITPKNPLLRFLGLLIMKIYFDTCCYNRPYDDQSQVRIRRESEAIVGAIKMVRWYGHTIIGSRALDAEIGRISDAEKRGHVLRLYRESVAYNAPYKKAVFQYIKPLAEAAGVKGIDVHHLAFAVASCADFLVTADDGFIEAVSGLVLPVKVVNPLNLSLGGML